MSAGAYLSKSRVHASEIELVTGISRQEAFKIACEWKLRSARSASIIIIDIDGYREMRDMYGREVGDQLLASVAARLRDLVETDVAIAHLGGDEFAVFSHHITSPRAAHGAARVLLDGLRQDYQINGTTLCVSVSVGVAVAPYHGRGVHDLLAAAELALCAAKRRGGDTICFFEPHLRTDVKARRELRLELSQAFLKGQFALVYQPQIDLVYRRIVGVEALLRWNHPTRGLLPPSSFIDVLDRMPIAREVGDWVLREAVAQAARWHQSGAPIRVAVNVFAAQFVGGGLPHQVLDLLYEFALPPSLLEIELTENTALHARNGVLDALNTFAIHRISVAIDDFGTGHAAISQLKTLPIKRLKIDKSFVVDLKPEGFDATLVTALVALGGKLGIDVLGVSSG